MKLLTRDEFREAVFSRDGHKCVVCGEPAVDAHHIIERRLFAAPHEKGGYTLDNGVSVCEEHHLACERTDISVEEIREYAGITKKVIPSHMYDDQVYDKWGNIILSNGTRLRGELFYDESVQKIIADHLHEFTHLVKYPRTYHLPWSPGMQDDDRMMPSLENFQGKRVIVTEKLDGENTSMYRDAFHARSLDSRHHYSRDWVKQFWSTIAHDIPDGWRICGENMYAEHSISYDNLETYFYGFSVWDDKNVCQSWDNTLEWFNLLGIKNVPVLYDGIWNEAHIKGLWNEEKWNTSEGYIVRLADQFPYGEFRKSVAKFVRANHIQHQKHWMFGGRITPNSMRVKNETE